ncbi:MAG: hypothetical protein C0631_02720 [Sedimenticola sp.]|nr:MAG: hypothetical protein C0631_02720 [Sedimenticola sp.]
MMSILNTITSDLDWREKEIANMRLLLLSTEITATQKKVLLRAAWAMLYAHYEGFCKNTLTAFYDFVCNSGVHCVKLPETTKLLALEASLKKLRSLPSSNLLDEIVNFENNNLSVTPEFQEVKSSNLYPNILIDFLTDADLSIDKVEEHRTKLKTLVSRRNSIAHGENNFIEGVPYYLTFESAVYDVIYDLALQVDSRLTSPPYI